MTKNCTASDRVAVRVVGLGNILLGDEGVGVHAARLLRERLNGPRTGLDILDGETGGLLLLDAFETAERIVVIDATADGQPPGTVTKLRPKYATDYPRTLSAHDVGLRDLMSSLQILGHWPDITLFAVSIHWPQPLRLDLTPDVQACLPALLDAVEAETRAEPGATG